MAGKISFPGVGQIKKVGAGGMAVKKISSGGAVLWTSSIPRQGVLKSGTQQLSQNTYEKVTGFKIDPAFPDTDVAAAQAANGLLVSGRASFVATGVMTTSGSTSITRGVRVLGNGSTLGEYSAGGSSSTREVTVVVPDGTDTLLELHALVSSTSASNRVLVADATGLMYRTGSYYEQLVDATFTRNTITEATLTPNTLAEWPHVPGSGIYLEAGAYQLIWGLYSVGWGTDWQVGARFGGAENQQLILGTSGNSWNRVVQTITVPSPQYVMPTVATSSNTYQSILANRLNLFISKI